jgi:hypothetical protein
LEAAPSDELVQASSPEDWAALHDLRRSELFARMEGVTYSADHPDDRAPNHFPLILKFRDQRIGTARLDLFENGGAAIRLVAIARQEQRKGHGRVMEQLFEELARSRIRPLWAIMSGSASFTKIGRNHRGYAAALPETACP